MATSKRVITKMLQGYNRLADDLAYYAKQDINNEVKYWSKMKHRLRRYDVDDIKATIIKNQYVLVYYMDINPQIKHGILSDIQRGEYV